MADGAFSLEFFKIARLEDLRNKPHAFVRVEGFFAGIRGNDAGTLLPAMLQGKESVIRKHGCIRVIVGSEDAAFMSWLVRWSLKRFQSRL